MDFAAPIIADGRMVGCFIGGQVLTEPPDISKIMQVADELGVDPASYIQAVMKVNIVEKSQIDKAASFYIPLQTVFPILPTTNTSCFRQILRLKRRTA